MSHHHSLSNSPRCIMTSLTHSSCSTSCMHNHLRTKYQRRSEIPIGLRDGRLLIDFGLLKVTELLLVRAAL